MISFVVETQHTTHNPQPNQDKYASMPGRQQKEDQNQKEQADQRKRKSKKILAWEQEKTQVGII